MLNVEKVREGEKDATTICTLQADQLIKTQYIVEFSLEKVIFEVCVCKNRVNADTV